MNDVEYHEKYELSNIEYPVRWGIPKTKHRASVILIGTEQECNDRSEKITDYTVDDTLKTKIAKKQTPKAIETANNNLRDDCQKELLESENLNQAIKIKELEARILNQQNQIDLLEKKNQELLNREKCKEKDIEKCNRLSLMSIATCIFNNFGNQADVENLLLMQPNEEEDNVSCLNLVTFRLFQL